MESEKGGEAVYHVRTFGIRREYTVRQATQKCVAGGECCHNPSKSVEGV